MFEEMDYRDLWHNGKQSHFWLGSLSLAAVAHTQTALIKSIYLSENNFTLNDDYGNGNTISQQWAAFV